MEDNWAEIVDRECFCGDHPSNNNMSTYDGSFTPVETCPIHGADPAALEDLGYHQS